MNEPSEQVDQLAYQVVGAAIEVHRVLGAGFLESVYAKAIAVELLLRGVAFEIEHPISLRYKGQPVGDARLDLLVGGLRIVELKAVERIIPIHHAQVINYLRATELQLGLLINFNVSKLTDGIERVVLTSH
ncbi:hypothetical protein Pla175_41070 [Pirellulimonas nuda]|uniref:GxxExxY protein n=2 Tax=Pirellulimonas nuda TaxID=2528009 RepID=A0A518DGV1_9BACT|nr:hypothetical protein Pla175_41070 [Pirellulimonas nuda]